MTVEFMLAKEYDKNMTSLKGNPPNGWYISEKYDGYRARWMKQDNIFLSRNEKPFNAPDWFKQSIPDEDFDGELWVGRDNFEKMGVVRKKIPIDEEWKAIKYIVYDLPNLKVPFKERIKSLKKIVEDNNKQWDEYKLTLDESYHHLKSPLIFAKQTIIKNKDHLEMIYQEIIKEGGEGIMLKHPDSTYENKRSNMMLKYKPVFDEEAIIIDYKLGKGKYEGLLGAFICKPLINMNTYHLIDSNENHEFTISGMDDEIRNEFDTSHPIGTIISYEHSGKTTTGKPRFGRYVRKRDDIIVKEKIESTSTEKRDNVISILKQISDQEKLNKNFYKASAYIKAISSLQTIQDDSELQEQTIKKLNGIGKSIYEKIYSILQTGTCPQYDLIQKSKDPRHIFLNIHGVGPEKAKQLIQEGFQSIDDLRNCKNISKYFHESQMIGLKYYEDLLERIPRQEIKRHETFLKKILSSIDKDAILTISGSYRRGKDTSGDIDILLKTKDNTIYKKFIDILIKFKYIQDNLALGERKYNGICKLKKCINRRIDIMNTSHQEFPFALLYFTGSDEFNKSFRKQCLDKGYTINEYGLKQTNMNEKINHEFKTEKNIFDFLQINYVEPNKR